MNSATPNALERFDDIIGFLGDGERAVFLDFDGTLAPIVARPELARMNDSMRNAVSRLASRWPVAVISGRDRADVHERVGIQGICYGGSHGFDISGPQGLRHEHPLGIAALPALDAAEQALRARLGGVTGVIIERKRFSIAVHYRLSAEQDIGAVERAVAAILGTYSGLRKGHGKKVLELLPDVEWDKGAALLWLLRALDLDRPDVRSLYLGDDVTDEDAFRAIVGRGLGIAVLDHPRLTAARYRLHDPHEVCSFLERLGDALNCPP